MRNIIEKDGLSEVDREKINTVMRQHNEIQQVILYGSRAKGNFLKGSDIDITILGELTWNDLNQIETELDDLLLPYQIDLSLFKNIDNEALIEHIERIGKVIYQK